MTFSRRPSRKEMLGEVDRLLEQCNAAIGKDNALGDALACSAMASALLWAAGESEEKPADIISNQLARVSAGIWMSRPKER